MAENNGENSVAVATKEVPATRSDLATRERTRYRTPAVDIYEAGEGLTLVADLPGVQPDGLQIQVENGVLTIEGRSNYAVQGDPVYSEFAAAHFFRQFELGEQVDQDKIVADLKNGVLTLRLPKTERARARRIEVKAR